MSGPSLPNAIIAELTNSCITTLPVKLTKFKGDLLDHSVMLSWITTEESNSFRFDIERSNSGDEFTSIGTEQANGYSNTAKNYHFFDKAPLKGNNYYRLRQVDIDGSFEYSKIIVIQNNENSLSFELLGNPIENRIVRFVLRNEDPTHIKLVDLQGKDLKFNLTKEGNIFSINTERNLVSGLYLLSLKVNNEVKTKKV